MRQFLLLGAFSLTAIFVLAATPMTPDFDPIDWGRNNSGPHTASTNTFEGSIPASMTAGNVCIEDFTILSPDRDLKEVQVLDKNGNAISSKQTFSSGSGTSWTNIVLDVGSEICDEDDPNFKIKIKVWGSGEWNYSVTPTVDGDGSEYFCGVVAGASPVINLPSQIATGTMIRFTNASASDLTEIEIVYANLDPNSDDPTISTADDVSNAFTNSPTISGSTVTFTGGSVEQNESFWIKVTFTAEVDGDLGAGATSSATF